MSERPTPASAGLILIVSSSAFALLGVLGELWLSSAPPVQVAEKPDPTGHLGKLIAFAFGAVFGLFLAVGLASYLLRFESAAVIRLVFAICILGGGFLSMRFGDDFWRGISE